MPEAPPRIRLGSQPPVVKPGRLQSAVQFGIGLFPSKPKVEEIPLPRQAPKIEPVSREIDTGKLIGEAILPGEGTPQTPEQKKGRELGGAEKDNWRSKLGSLVESTENGEVKETVKQIRNQVEEFGTGVNEDGEIERVDRADKKRYTVAKDLVKNIEDVLEGRAAITDVNSDLYKSLAGVIQSGGGDLARQLSEAPDDGARVAIIQNMVRSTEYRQSVAETLQRIAAESNPNDKLIQTNSEVAGSEDAVRQKQTETRLKQKRIKDLKKELSEYEAGKSGLPDGKYYKELHELEESVKHLQTQIDLMGTEIEDTLVNMDQRIVNAISLGLPLEIKSLPDNDRQQVQDLYAKQIKQAQLERKLKLDRKRLETPQQQKQKIENDLKSAQNAIDEERMREQAALSDKGKADKKFGKAQNSKKDFEEEVIEDLKSALSEGVKGYVSKRVSRLEGPITQVLEEMATQEADHHKKNLETALQYRYEERVQVETTIRGKKETKIEKRPKSGVVSEDYEVLTSQTNVDTGGDALVRHILETSEQFCDVSTGLNGERILTPRGSEIDQLMQNQEFLQKMRPLTVKLTLLKRLETEGMDPAEMLSTLRTSWGQEFVQSAVNDPDKGGQIKSILQKFGVTAEPGTQEFQEQLENAVLKPDVVLDPTDPEKDPVKKNKVQIGGLVFAALLVPFITPSILQSISGEGDSTAASAH